MNNTIIEKVPPVIEYNPKFGPVFSSDKEYIKWFNSLTWSDKQKVCRHHGYPLGMDDIPSLEQIKAIWEKECIMSIPDDKISTDYDEEGFKNMHDTVESLEDAACKYAKIENGENKDDIQERIYAAGHFTAGAVWNQERIKPIIEGYKELIRILSNANQYVPFDVGTKNDIKEAITKSETILKDL